MLCPMSSRAMISSGCRSSSRGLAVAAAASAFRPSLRRPVYHQHITSNNPSISYRQLFNKAQKSRRSSSKHVSVATKGPGAKPKLVGPQNSSWGSTMADLGPIPRSFYLGHESTILRPRYSGKSAWFGLTTVTGINILIFGMWNEPGQDEEWMMQNFTTNIENSKERPWTLSTSSISHQNGMHILGNMFAMWLFGFNTYRVIGAFEFAKLYVMGGIACSGTHVLHNLATGKTQPPLNKEERDTFERMAEAQGIESVKDLPPQVRERVEYADKPSLGASGSVMAISAVAASLFPLDNVRLNPRMFYMPLPVAVGIFVASDLFGITQEGSPTDHAGHLGGLAFGALYAYSSWYSGRWGVTGQLPIVYRFKQMIQQRK
mmetsp:Transcript_27929/g.62176  ORF Transcript_27929/g.62176 Transcript_27929/m.62176 type:complete len:375 (-) Transcript_27929:27-1151(-)